MIRLRARFLALCALGFLPLAVQAASIKVTTPLDIVADNDELCSLREAVAASVTASAVGKRTSIETSLTTTLETLEKALLDIAEDPQNITYPRNDMLASVESAIAEIEDYAAPAVAADATIAADLAKYRLKILALGTSRGFYDLSKPGGNAYPTASESPPLQPGYYTYSDIDNSHPPAPPVPPATAPTPTPITVVDPLNIDSAGVVGGGLTYIVNDIAYWDGSNWRRYAGAAAVPRDVDTAGVTEGIALLERVKTLVTAEKTRLEGIEEIDGCDDGTSFDVLLMEDDTTYFLNDEIELPVRLSIRGDGLTTRIERCRAGSGACESTSPVKLHRFFKVPQGISTEILNLTLAYGDAGTANGGAVLVEGPLTMTNVNVENCRAAAGGAIHMESTGAVELNDVQLIGNIATTGHGGAIYQLGNSLTMTGVLLRNNQSLAGNGGGVALDAAANGNLIATQTAFIGNEAEFGGAVNVSRLIGVVRMANVTIAQNLSRQQAALNVDMDTNGLGSVEFNNVTLVENTGNAGTGGIRMAELQPLLVYNSLIAGNIAPVGNLRPDCDLAGVIDSTKFRRNYYSESLGAAADACPGSRYPSGVPETENFELDSATQPLIGYLLNPLNLAAGPFYVPVFPDNVNDSSENRLVNRGAGTQEDARCDVKDQRDLDRSSSVDEECDIGAIEYQIGRRKDETVEFLVDERRCVNLISDDIGDAQYVNGTLQVFNIEREGFSAVVISREPGAADNHADIDPALDLDDVTLCPNQADIPYREAILIIPARGFRGETDIVYGMEWQTVGTTPVEGSVTAIAHIQTESRAGIKTSTLGALPLTLAVLLGVMLALRRARLGMFAAVLLAFAVAPARAESVIYVNSSLDQPISVPGDGRCTLREAFDSARNDRANMTNGDCVNGNEGPDIIEFFAGIEEVVLEDTIVSYGNVTLRCPTPPVPADGEPPPATPAVQQECKIRRRALEADGVTANQNQFRLIDSRGSFIVSRITFQDGQAPDRGAGQDGGAIFSTGSLTVFDSVFRNNTAVSGGAIFLAGASSGLNVIRSVFEGNGSRAGTVISGGIVDVSGLPPAQAAARVTACPMLMLAREDAVDGTVGNLLSGGGAIATTQSDGHKISIVASSFVRNCSVVGAAAVDLNTRSTAAIGNSTFSKNVSFEGPGAIDVSGVRSNATLRNVNILENLSGLAKVSESWDGPAPDLQRRALQTGSASVTLTSSIIAGNYRESDPARAANCPSFNTLGSVYNVFGDEDEDAGAGVVTPGVGYTCALGPANSHNRLMYADEVYNPANVASGLLSHLVVETVEDTDLYIYLIRDAVVAAGILVDAGFDEGDSAEDNQVDPSFTTTAKCANVDVRGASRVSGDRCDIGVFEVLGVTAKDDAETNMGRSDRFVVLDVIANDVFDNLTSAPGKALKQDCDTAEPVEIDSTTQSRTYRFSRAGHDANADGEADACIEVIVPKEEYVTGMGSGVVKFLRKGVAADELIIGGEPNSGYVIQYDNGGVLRDEDNLGLGLINLTYRVYTVDQSGSSTAKITLGVENVPPKARGDIVTVGVGESGSINVLANDEDPDSPPTNLSVSSISGAGCTEVRSDDDLTTLYWQCQFGKVTLTGAGTISWTPDNSFNPFSQDLTYEVVDGDPQREKASKATLRFEVIRPVASGGSILGDDDLSDMLGLDFLGTTSPAFLLTLLLGLVRRRV